MSVPFNDKRLFLIGGPGGVGKTTLAAALSTQFALQGFRTVVLTVDPAKRLAQALGLESFHQDLQPVQHSSFTGTLHASMLDTQHYFDKLIARFATSEIQKEKILHHPIYQTMVESLGGTHEYAAMERLLEFAQNKDFDRIVIDTPPSQNAIELFSAPERLADFMDASVLKWFQGPVPAYLKLLRTGTQMAMKLVQKVFGADFLQSFSDLLNNLEGMQAGFRQRHLEVIELLQNPQTAFFLVTTATAARLKESQDFSVRLREAQIPLSGIILNRLEPKASIPTSEATASEEKGLYQMLEYYYRVYTEQAPWISGFQEHFSSLPLFQIPKQTEALHQIDALVRLGGKVMKTA